MPYNRSKIGEFGGVSPDVLTRNSFKIFDSSETEIIAIDFEKLGINTLHSKDRTLITEVQYADVRSIAGEIAPGYEIAHSYTPRPALEPVEIVKLHDNYKNIATIRNMYVSAYMPYAISSRVYQSGELLGDTYMNTGEGLLNVLPEEISVDIVVKIPAHSSMTAVMRVPVIPQLGFMEAVTVRGGVIFEALPDNTLLSPASTLHFGATTIEAYRHGENELAYMGFSNGFFQPWPLAHNEDACISIVRDAVTQSNITEGSSSPRLELSASNTHTFVSNNAFGDVSKHGGINCVRGSGSSSLGTEAAGKVFRTVNVIKVACRKTNPFNALMTIGKMYYKLSSLSPAAQNSLEKRSAIDPQNKYTPLNGREYFVAVPDRVELSDNQVKTTVSIETLTLAFDSPSAVEAKSITRRKLATIGKESIYAYFLKGNVIPPSLHENWDLPQPKGGLVDFPMEPWAPEMLRCVIGIELEDGRMLVPEDIDSALILPTGEPISQTLVCNKAVRRDGGNDDVSYTLDLAMGRKKVSVSLTRTTAKAVSPIAYGDSRVLDIDMVKMVVLDNKDPLPIESPTLVETDKSLHFIEGGWGVIKGMSDLDYCPPLEGQEHLEMLPLYNKDLENYCRPPNRRTNDVSLFFGNLDAVSDSIKTALPVAYGSPVPVFTHKTAMQAHCEYKGIASEYYGVTIFPILFPQLVALKTDLLSRPVLTQIEPENLSNYYSKENAVWVYAANQKRLGFSLTGIKRTELNDIEIGSYGVSFPWSNIDYVYVNPLYGGVHKIYGHTYTGSVLLVSPPALLENGVPETVTFTNDAVGTEFTGKNHVYSPLTIEAQNREFLATDEMLYEPSLLYPLTSTKDRYVQSYPAAVNGYLCISQFVFARMNDVTHIYLFTEKDIGLLASVHGKVAEYPIMTMAGLLFASVEPDKVVVYVYQNNSILPIKNVKAKNARACLVTDKQVGTVLYVLSGDNQLSVYLIDGPIITMNKSIPFTGSFSLSQHGAETEVMVTAANGKYLNLTSLDEVTEYHLKSSEFHFPLIEGYKPVLSGMKLVFDHVPNSTYDLRVWVNETCIFSKNNIPCDVESIQRFNTELPVGSASYEINNCTGILRNVFWLVYPLPLLTETIEKYAPSLNPPVLELEEKEESVEVTIRHTNGNPIIDIAYDEDFENCVEGYRGRIPEAGIPLPGFEATATLTVPVTASGQTIYARAACFENNQSSEYTLESLTLAPVSLSTPRLSHVASSNQKAVIAIRGSQGEEYGDYVDGFEVDLWKPGDELKKQTIFAPMTQVTIPKHYVKAGSVVAKARACLNQFKSEYSNTIVIDFENLDVSSIYGIFAVADETTATINWKAGGLYETFNLDLRDSNGMGRMITGIDELIANVTDLEPDTDYFVSIQAKYKNRLGDWSKVYRFRTTPRVTPVLTSFPMGGSAVMFECTSFKDALSYEFIIIETDERHKTDAPAFMFVPASPGSYSCFAELNMSDGSIKSSNTLKVQITGDMELIEIDEANTTLDIIAEHTKEFKAGINIAWIIPDQYNRSGAQLLHYGIDIGYHDSGDYDLESDIIVGVRASSYYYEAHLQDRPEYFTVSVTAVYADGVNDTVSHTLYFT